MSVLLRGDLDSGAESYETVSESLSIQSVLFELSL